MILVAIAIVLLSLLLAGCSSSSPLVPDIFLIDFFYKSYTPQYDPTQVNPGVAAAIANIVGEALLEVRVGYFGLCVTPDGHSYLCSNNATLLAEQISIEQDPLNLIYIANTFKNDVVFPYLLIVAIVFAFACFVVLATFPSFHTLRERDGTTYDIKTFPNRFAAQGALALIFIASVFVLVSVLWQHTASVAAAQVAQDFGNGSVKSGVGAAAMVLGWFGFVLFILVTLSLTVLVLSISLLSTLADDESESSGSSGSSR